MKIFLLPLHAADDQFLSRLDPALLSQQALMEMFVEKFQKKTDFHDEHGNYKDCCEWEGTECDDTGAVQKFYLKNTWSQSLPFSPQFLPRSIRKLEMYFCAFSGPLTPEDLPERIESLTFSYTQFVGTLNVGHLPRRLKVFYLNAEKIHGTVDLGHMPPRMREFELVNSPFTGSVCFDDLPQKLKVLELGGCSFSGEIIIRRLPNTLTYLSLSNNYFTYLQIEVDLPKVYTLAVQGLQETGGFPFERFPRAGFLDLEESELTGTMNAATVSARLESLKFAYNSMFGTIDFAALASTEMMKFDISDNFFEGTVDFENLLGPPQDFNISHNLFEGMVFFGDNNPSESFDISHNYFSGSLDLSSVHLCGYINVSNNQLSGIVRFGPMDRCFTMDISNNALTGTIETEELRQRGAKIIAHDTKCVDENGQPFVKTEIAELS